MTDTGRQFADAPPAGDHVTEYDRKHTTTYLRLLDADAAGADWRQVAVIVLGLDPDGDADRARRVHDAHLARARWMTTTGYRELAEGKPDRR